MLHSCYLPAGESELKHTYYLCRGGKQGMARGKGFRKTNLGPRETAWWVRAMAALPENEGPIPSIHMVAHYCL